VRGVRASTPQQTAPHDPFVEGRAAARWPRVLPGHGSQVATRGVACRMQRGTVGRGRVHQQAPSNVVHQAHAWLKEIVVGQVVVPPRAARLQQSSRRVFLAPGRFFLHRRTCVLKQAHKFRGGHLSADAGQPKLQVAAENRVALLLIRLNRVQRVWRQCQRGVHACGNHFQTRLLHEGNQSFDVQQMRVKKKEGQFGHNFRHGPYASVLHFAKRTRLVAVCVCE
jgi:hypothetical protein